MWLYLVNNLQINMKSNTLLSKLKAEKKKKKNPRTSNNVNRQFLIQLIGAGHSSWSHYARIHHPKPRWETSDRFEWCIGVPAVFHRAPEAHLRWPTADDPPTSVAPATAESPSQSAAPAPPTSLLLRVSSRSQHGTLVHFFR